MSQAFPFSQLFDVPELFRSESMQYVRLTMTNDSAYDTLRELGKHRKLHLENLAGDIPTAAEQTNKRRIQECITWERRLNRFEEEMRNNDVDVPDKRLGTEDENIYIQPNRDLLDVLSEYLVPLEQDLNRDLDFRSQESQNLYSLQDRQVVLYTLQRANAGTISRTDEDLSRLGQSSSNNAGLVIFDDDDFEEKKAPRGDDVVQLHNEICGTIPILQQAAFERLVWRLSRGNAIVRFYEMPDKVMDPMTKTLVEKVVFHTVIISKQIHMKISKMCEYFGATQYVVPPSGEQLERELVVISAQISEKQRVLDLTTRQIKDTLSRVALDQEELNREEPRVVSPLRRFINALQQEKSICDALRKCRSPDNSRLVTAEGWIHIDDIEWIRASATAAVKHLGIQPAVLQFLPAPRAPPTYFKLNKFTSTFQGIVDTYGVPRYKEVNPGLFTVFTFPFLFGIMYGDIGHGSLLFLASLYVVFNEHRFQILKNNGQLGEIGTMLFGGRYLILMMGACAVYCGLIYNDLFSIPLNIFGTRWTFSEDTNSAVFTGSEPYPFGVDPSWYHTRNELSFMNSLKMKIAVTIGVVQMVFGIILGVFNHIYFGDKISIFCEFIPQLVFMLCTFGYMIFIIIYKFGVDWVATGRNPPNLIQTMIGMFLSPGTVESDKLLYEGQAGLQVVLVLFAVFSVPVMLFAKPLILSRAHKSHGDSEHGSSISSSKNKHGDSKHGKFNPDADNVNLMQVVVTNEEGLIEDSVAMDERKVNGIQLDVIPNGTSSGHNSPRPSSDMPLPPPELDIDQLKAAAALPPPTQDDHHEFSELFIHQSIHTIEFVLGAVSNTASYLRLWALSLAHAELSNVFWEKMIMEYGVVNGNPIGGLVGFAVWFAATFAVLLCMDTLECFLHALRLHWVEFQNKFYRADGYAFQPFSLDPIED